MVRPPRKTHRFVLPPAGGDIPRVRFPGASAERTPPSAAQAFGGRSSSASTEERIKDGQDHPGGQGRTGGSGGTAPKRARTDGPEDGAVPTNQEKSSGSCGPNGDVAAVVQQGAAEDGRSAELQSVRSLKVTIQQSSESREFSQPPAGPHCHVCDLTCRTLQLFQEHMSGAEHLAKLQEVTHCIRRHTRALQDRGRHPETQRWCSICQNHFLGDVIVHRRTKEHKACKQQCRPFCPVCRCHFRTPRKFVEHMKSPEHKEKVQQEEAQEEELITVDAIGCFQEEEQKEAAKENEEEEEEEEEEEVVDEQEEEEEEMVTKEEEVKVAVEEEEKETDPGSDLRAPQGASFVVPVCGFVCQLCNKFFYTETAARHTHCKTHTHHLNLQSHRAMMKRSGGEDEG